MRHYFSLFLALFAAIFGFYLIWQFAQPELNGHWEIVEGGEEMGSPPITSLYIGPTGNVMVTQPGLEGHPLSGETNRYRHEIRLGPPSHAAYFDLSWSGDTLLFSAMFPRHFYLNPHKLTGKVMKGVRK